VVPPVALTVTVELPPWHRIGELEELATTPALGSVIDPVVVEVQLLASVTVYEYVPAGWLNVPVPVYPGVPPVALTVTVELPPWHRIAVLVELADSASGSVIVPVVVAVQLLASVTV
jgi:hypothetical protein